MKGLWAGQAQKACSLPGPQMGFQMGVEPSALCSRGFWVWGQERADQEAPPMSRSPGELVKPHGAWAPLLGFCVLSSGLGPRSVHPGRAWGVQTLVWGSLAEEAQF